MLESLLETCKSLLKNQKGGPSQEEIDLEVLKEALASMTTLDVEKMTESQLKELYETLKNK